MTICEHWRTLADTGGTQRLLTNALSGHRFRSVTYAYPQAASMRGAFSPSALVADAAAVSCRSSRES